MDKKTCDGLWSELWRLAVANPLTRFDSDVYTPEEIRGIILLMRRMMDEAERNPAAEARWGTRCSDFQDMYDTFQKMADMRGIVVEDENESNGKSEE